MTFLEILQVAFGLLVVAAIVALIVAFPWLLILVFCGSPIFLNRHGA